MIPKKTAAEAILDQEISPGGLAVRESYLWTIDEVACFLQLTPETIRAMARQQEIPAFKIHRRWRFRREDIEKWINKMAEQR